MNNQTIDSKLYPEAAKFLAWHEAETRKGLVDIKFFPLNTREATLESFCAEVNQALAAPRTEDPELF
jgi:hypothetical protein